MKRPFLYGFRGKAAWRVNRVIFGSALIIYLYMKINETSWSAAIARQVPLPWKLLVLFIFLSSVSYAFWRMGRHISNPELPLSNRVWLLLPLLMAFGFAIISADCETLFLCGGILWMPIGWGFGRYFRWKRLQRGLART
jgi:hypothetical protein